MLQRASLAAIRHSFIVLNSAKHLVTMFKQQRSIRHNKHRHKSQQQKESTKFSSSHSEK